MRHSLRLYRVGRAITSSLDLGKLYDITLDSLIQALPAEAGLMSIYNTEKTVLKIKSTKAARPTVPDTSSHKLFIERFESGMRGTEEVKTLYDRFA